MIVFLLNQISFIFIKGIENKNYFDSLKINVPPAKLWKTRDVFISYQIYKKLIWVINFGTVGSPFFHEITSVPYRTVPYRTVPQHTVYRSKKKRTIWTDLALKMQFSVYRSVPKMHFIPFFNTEKLYERDP